MSKIQGSEVEIIRVLKEPENGVPVPDVCLTYGMRRVEQHFIALCVKLGGLPPRWIAVNKVHRFRVVRSGGKNPVILGCLRPR